MSLLTTLHLRWNALAPREKTGLKLACTLVGGALLWQLSLGPSLAVWRTSEAQMRALDAQLASMQSMQAQVSALKGQSGGQNALSFDDAVRALTLATRQTLGTSAQFNLVGDRANITLQGTSADALAKWLAAARQNARSVPLEARLTRATPVGATNVVSWNGTLVMALPQR